MNSIFRSADSTETIFNGDTLFVTRNILRDTVSIQFFAFGIISSDLKILSRVRKTAIYRRNKWSSETMLDEIQPVYVQNAVQKDSKNCTTSKT